MNQVQNKILLVDDSQSTFVVFEAIFSHLPYQIVKATSGLEALRLIEQQDFDLFLINVNMPVMDGFETAYRIRKEAKFLKTPLIFITAYDRDQVYAKSPQHILTEEFIFKPFDPELVIAKVERALGEHLMSFPQSGLA